MECNNEEAEKVMAKAEEKFKAKDIDGAKKFALKAKTLFPSLPGVPQAIAAYEVHITGKKRKRGETDWCYTILGAEPADDLQAIKQRYKKLCVQIHPDKNHSAAAEGAFKLVKEAWDKISKIYTGAQSDGAKNPAGPKAGQSTNTTTKNSNGPNAHPGTNTPNNAHRGRNTSSTHGGPTNANGGPGNTANTSHACGGGGKHACGSSNTADPANARRPYWHRRFSNADGSYHIFHHCGTNASSTNASTGFGSINELCPNCGRQAMNVDADGLAIRCNRCNMLPTREQKDGRFMLQLGGMSVQGSNNVSVKILDRSTVVTQGGGKITINKATAVTVKDGKNINIEHSVPTKINVDVKVHVSKPT